MNRTQTLTGLLVALTIISFVVLDVTDHGGDGVWLIGAVPALIGLVTLQQVKSGHEQRTAEHADTSAKLATVDYRVYQVEQRVAALSNGELVDKIRQGTALGLADHLQTSSIVEHPYRRAGDSTTAPLVLHPSPDVAAQLAAVEAQAAKSRP